MNNSLLGIAGVIASVAFLISSISDSIAYPQGPNVNTGSNPIVSLDCNGGYVVPVSSDLIITDFIGVSSYPTLRVDGVNTLYLTDGTHSLTTGWRVPAGGAISCVSGSAYLTGYLTKP